MLHRQRLDRQAQVDIQGLHICEFVIFRRFTRALKLCENQKKKYARRKKEGYREQEIFRLCCILLPDRQRDILDQNIESEDPFIGRDPRHYRMFLIVFV